MLAEAIVIGSALAYTWWSNRQPGANHTSDTIPAEAEVKGDVALDYGNKTISFTFGGAFYDSNNQGDRMAYWRTDNYDDPDNIGETVEITKEEFDARYTDFENEGKDGG